jgi:hypothetical protein
MPDIREILNALDVDDRALWSEHRTIMRRSFLNAHNETVGMGKWSHEDDAFLDLIDIRLALLFDRAGRLNATHDIVGDGAEIEQNIKDMEDKAKVKLVTLPDTKMSEASRLLQEGFGSVAAASWPVQRNEK